MTLLQLSLDFGPQPRMCPCFFPAALLFCALFKHIVNTSFPTQQLELRSCLPSDMRVWWCDFTVFCACQAKCLVSYTFLQAKDVFAIQFCKGIISWVSMQVVFSAWAQILKNLPLHPFVDYCQICLMSVSIPVSAFPLCFVLFPTPCSWHHHFSFADIISTLHALKIPSLH